MANFVRFSTYDEAKFHWAGVQKQAFRSPVAALKYLSDSRDFIADLQQIAAATGDPRFHSAIEALYEHNLVSGLSWNSRTPFRHIEALERQYELTAIGCVKSAVQGGDSLRLAIASTVANLGWPGNSFEAAVKRVERLWRAADGAEL